MVGGVGMVVFVGFVGSVMGCLGWLDWWLGFGGWLLVGDCGCFDCGVLFCCLDASL